MITKSGNYVGNADFTDSDLALVVRVFETLSRRDDLVTAIASDNEVGEFIARVGDPETLAELSRRFSGIATRLGRAGGFRVSRARL